MRARNTQNTVLTGPAPADIEMKLFERLVNTLLGKINYL
jgi:hypothetical protein